MSLMRVWALLVVSGCGRLAFDPVGTPSSQDASPSDAVELGTGPFGSFRLVTELDSNVDEDDPAVSSDGLELFWASKRTGPSKIWTARRASRSDPWSAPQEVVELSLTTDDKSPELSADALTLVFGAGGDLALSTRASRTDSWSQPVIILDAGTPSLGTPALCNENLRLYMRFDAGTTIDHLYVSDRATTTASWSTPMPVDELNSTAIDSGPWVSADCNRLYFDSDRNQNGDVFMAHRNPTTDLFGAPTQLPELRVPFGSVHDVSLTADEKYIVWSHQSTVNKLYEATR